MRIRALDGNFDWTFGKGLNNYVEQDSAIGQNIRCRLLSWEGDCFWALHEGLNWRYFLEKGKEEELKLAIKSEILKSWGVYKLTELSVSTDEQRKLSITYAVETIYGTEFQSTITEEQIT